MPLPSETPAADRDSGAGGANPPPADATRQAAATLERIEQVLGEIRGRLDALDRERRYRSFSLARLAAAVLQALVIGFLLAALADWLFYSDTVQAGAVLVKLGFAAVLQLAALTGFAVGRDA